MWHSPVPHLLIPTSDSNSYTRFDCFTTGIPIGNHCGAFGAVRKHDIHTGVDIYVQNATPVTAVESGRVVLVEPFTGPMVGFDWWEDTKAVVVEGNSGFVVYGEVAPHVKVGQTLVGGEQLGVVIPVLKVNKGRPTCMLHLELWDRLLPEFPLWLSPNNRPVGLLDPTEKLCGIR